MRGVLRGRRLLAAAVVVALAAAGASLVPARPAEAQTPTIVSLVSNTGQTASSPLGFIDGTMNATGFTTGSNATGYTLTSVGVSLQVSGTLSGSALSTLKAEVWSDSSGTPDAKLWDLTNPSSITTGVVSFAAPSNTTLAGSTTYHVVLSGPGDIMLVGTASGDEDSGGAAGWSIAAKSMNDLFGGSWGDSGGIDFRMDVKGYANPLPTTFVSNTGQTASTAATLERQWKPVLTTVHHGQQCGRLHAVECRRCVLNIWWWHRGRGRPRGAQGAVVVRPSQRVPEREACRFDCAVERLVRDLGLCGAGGNDALGEHYLSSGGRRNRRYR